MKKFIAILLCGSIIISMNVFSAFALDQQISTDAAAIKETEIQNTIAENIASQTEFTPEELKSATLIDIHPGTQNLIANSTPSKALQVTKSEGELVTTTTLIPYEEDNGQLVNSFALANETWPIYGGTSNFNVGGIVLSIQVQYHKKTNTTTWITYKRHVGAKMKWNTSNSNKVTDFYLKFESMGQEYAYPNCITSANPQPISNVKKIYSTTINQSNPSKNIFYSRSNMGSLDRMFYLNGVSPMNPDGNVYWKFHVNINGSIQEQDGSFDPYKS